MNKSLKHVLIVENSLNGLTLNESVNSVGKKQMLLGGVFTEFDKMNRNERIYTADKFLPHLNEMMERKNSLGAIYGEFDHPDVFDTSLSRASHVVENAWYNQAENRVDGQIRLLNTHWGKEAQAIVNDGLPLFVSSRAAGVTEGNGHVSVKKLFTYDAVADPGFGSAKMSSVNESLGFGNSSNSNYRIYELTNESKFNDLIMDNKNNDFVTKNQMDDYSNYLNVEIAKINETLTSKINEGNISPEEINALAETQELMMEQQEKIAKYLDYLSEKVQIAFTENKELKATTEKLIEHNDHLVENLNETNKKNEELELKLNKNISYSEYIAETLDKNIDFSEYIAEHVNTNIEFSDYLAENLEKGINYAEYVAENLDKNIAYSEYLAENLDSNIAYSEYLAENLDSNIAYSEYLAENLDNNINYAEYIAEHVDNNIAYAEYIAEHVDNNIAYAEYIAENVSDSQAYMNYIAEGLDNTIEALKTSPLNEGVGGSVQIPNMKNIDDVTNYYDEDDDFVQTKVQGETAQGHPVQIDVKETPEGQAQTQAQIQTQNGENVQTPVQVQTQNGEEIPIQDVPVQGEVQPGQEQIQGQPVQGEMNPVQDDINAQTQLPGSEMPTSVEGEELGQAQFVDGATVTFGDNGTTAEIIASNPEAGIYTVKTADGDVEEVHESQMTFIGNSILENSNQLTSQIQKLILETKKRKASEVKEPHFVQFLTEKNKKAWYDLIPSDKEKVIFAINESKTNIYSEAQLLNAITDALTEKVSFEDVLINNMPSSLQPIWEKLDETVKTGILSQAKLGYNLNTNLKIEKFWESRNLSSYMMINETKQVLNENRVIDNSTLSDDEIDSFISKLKNLER